MNLTTENTEFLLGGRGGANECYVQYPDFIFNIPHQYNIIYHLIRVIR